MESGQVFFKAIGFATITDKTTGEVLLDGKKNAVHLGNLSGAIVQALSAENNGFIRYMAFGNGGTLISESGEIIYRQPNVTNIRNTSDSLYNETFKKEILQEAGNEVVPVLTNTTYSDINIIITLDTNEPNLTQMSIDRADSLDTTTILGDDYKTYSGASNGEAVFDEIALYCGEPSILGPMVNNTSDAILITHLIFHPIQKSANRVLEIDYTLRIQLT